MGRFDTMRWPIKPLRWASLLAAGFIIAGCGASANAGTAAPSSTATATPLALATITVTTTATATSAAVQPCSGAQPLAGSDFSIDGPSFTNLTYPGVQLHQDTPSAPLLLGTSEELHYTSVPVNPSLVPGGGYQVFLCNSSTSRSHQVTSISVRIESLAPFAGRLLEWPRCTAAYTRSRPPGSGCGGGNYFDERVVASFPAGAPAGTTVLTTLQDAGPMNAENPKLPPFGPLPATVGPGRGISINAGLQMTNPSATYAFSVGVSIDGAAPLFSQPTAPVLLAPVAQTWSGAACQAPAMQAQIPPATDPPTYYICPAS